MFCHADFSQCNLFTFLIPVLFVFELCSRSYLHLVFSLSCESNLTRTNIFFLKTQHDEPVPMAARSKA